MSEMFSSTKLNKQEFHPIRENIFGQNWVDFEHALSSADTEVNIAVPYRVGCKNQENKADLKKDLANILKFLQDNSIDGNVTITFCFFLNQNASATVDRFFQQNKEALAYLSSQALLFSIPEYNKNGIDIPDYRKAEKHKKMWDQNVRQFSLLLENDVDAKSELAADLGNYLKRNTSVDKEEENEFLFNLDFATQEMDARVTTEEENHDPLLCKPHRTFPWEAAGDYNLINKIIYIMMNMNSQEIIDRKNYLLYKEDIYGVIKTFVSKWDVKLGFIPNSLYLLKYHFVNINIELNHRNNKQDNVARNVNQRPFVSSKPLDVMQKVQTVVLQKLEEDPSYAAKFLVEFTGSIFFSGFSSAFSKSEDYAPSSSDLKKSP